MTSIRISRKKLINILKTKTKDIPSLGHYNLFRAQFSGEDVENLSEFGLIVDHLDLIEDIYLQSSVLPSVLLTAEYEKNFITGEDSSDLLPYVINLGNDSNNSEFQTVCPAMNNFTDDQFQTNQNRYHSTPKSNYDNNLSPNYNKRNDHNGHRNSIKSNYSNNSDDYSISSTSGRKRRNKSRDSFKNNAGRKLDRENTNVENSLQNGHGRRNNNYRENYNSERNLNASYEKGNSSHFQQNEENLMKSPNKPQSDNNIQILSPKNPIHPDLTKTNIDEQLNNVNDKINAVNLVEVQHSESISKFVNGSYQPESASKKVVENKIIEPIQQNASNIKTVFAGISATKLDKLGAQYKVIFGDQLGDYYFIRNSADENNIKTIQNTINSEQNLIPWENKNERKVLVRVDSILYRGLVQANSRIENTHLIQLVDVGWFVDIPYDENVVFLLPESLKTTPPFSMAIKIMSNTFPIERNSVVNVTVKSIEKNLTFVDIVNAYDKVSSNEDASNAPISRNANLELNKRVTIVFLDIDPKNPEYLQVCDTSALSQVATMNDLLQKYNVQMISEPKVGDFCAYHFNKVLWLRAKIISSNPLKVFCIDTGNIQIIDKIDLEQFKLLPCELYNIKPFLFTIRFFNKNNSSRQIKPRAAFDITPLDYKDSVYTVLKDDELKVSEPISVQENLKLNSNPIPKPNLALNAQSKSLQPNYTNAGINQKTLLTLNKSTLLSFVQNDAQDLSLKWVQSSNFLTELGIKFEEEIVKSAVFDAEFVTPPQSGDFCLSFYDDVWSRAKIVQMNPLTVFFIDYGNTEQVDLTKIKPLPTALSFDNPAAYKIKFYYDKNQSLQLNYGDNIQITPVQISEDDVHTVLLNDELEDMKLIMSRVYCNSVKKIDLNKPVDLLWVQNDEYDQKFAWVQVAESFTEVLGDITTVMDSSTEKFAETPHLGDLCMKMYEEMWCRACIASVNPLTVFYIDFGNVEKIESIDDLRPLPKELYKINPLAFRIQIDSTPQLAYEFAEQFVFTPINFKDNVYIGKV